MTGSQGDSPSAQPVNSGCLSMCPYSSTVSWPSPGISQKRRGVQPASRRISTLSPAIGCSRHQAAISSAARSMWPFDCQAASKSGDLFGMRTYSESLGTIESLNAADVACRAWCKSIEVAFLSVLVSVAERRQCKAKEAAGIAGGQPREGFRRFAATARRLVEDGWKERGLVATVRGTGLQRAGQQVGRVRLQHQPVVRDARRGRSQGSAAALVADPAGNADRQAEREAFLEHVGSLREAMQDGTARDFRVVAQHRQEVAARIPLVQKKWLVEPRGEAELEVERTALLGGR